MEKYKQRKQTNNLLHVFLLTFFIFASLFSVTGIVYSLVTVGIGNPLSLLCAIGFATCTTLSACNAYAIRNNITHRRGAPQKETACSTNKKPITLEGNSKNLIDLSDQPTPNEKCDTQQYTSDYIFKTSEEILTPEVVENVKQNNKPNLILDDKKSPTNQNLKSPIIPQTQGSNFAGPTRGIAIQQSNNPVILHQPQKNPISPIPEINMVNKSKTLLQSQNISNQNIPIPPPMPIVVKDKSKILSQPQNTINQSMFIISPVSVAAPEMNPNYELSTISQSQVTEQNNSNKQEEVSQQPNSSVASTSSSSEVSSSDEPRTISQVTEQDDIEHHKEEIDQQPNSVASEFQTPPPPPPMPENSFSVDKPKIINQLQHIKDISQTMLKRVGESEKNKYSESDRDKLLRGIRKGVRLKPIDNSKNSNELTGIALTMSNRISLDPDLMKKMDEIRKAKDGSTTPDWEEEVKISSEIQEESSNKSTENYAENNNDNRDSGISDGESSPEKINNHIDKGRRSSSNSYTEGSVERPQGLLSHSSSCPSFIDINMSTL
ncbi:MAG: hypothetical protein sL5_03830 [Candidatus Mesenet longicola]|uniref:WH2 domain-containing protein n=1 Tax=Candidatus Mesenet longicola TaxID=1892558 RepID=A0A8J3MNZ7_9RICK|nr:MAG: hypothetical protein sGL2_03660 [Candidatus Mesenet longicola]GHM59390.1 MAG: hypothetical protein sL5_03830 [Candidatus Mesenet longicola]